MIIVIPELEIYWFVFVRQLDVQWWSIFTWTCGERFAKIVEIVLDEGLLILNFLSWKAFLDRLLDRGV